MSGGDLFRGTATYYARFRPAYPDQLIGHLVERHQLDHTSRVLDLGAGQDSWRYHWHGMLAS